MQPRHTQLCQTGDDKPAGSYILYMYYTVGLNHLPFLVLSISVSMAVIQKIFNKLYEGSWAESSMLLKLRNDYYIV